MKRILSLIALVLMTASCVNEVDNTHKLWLRTGPNSEAPVFYATIEGSDDAATKVFADEQMRVLWNADDHISVFNKYTFGEEYSFSGEDGDNAGSFQKVPGSGIVTGNDLEHIYAVYPYNENNKISNSGVLTVTLPSVQTYKPHSFGIGANTMVSVTDDGMLKFRNVGGYLSFKLYGTDVSVRSITLKGNNSEKLAGNATVTMVVGGVPTATLQSETSETITLTCQKPVTLGNSITDYTEFWFVVPPMTFTNGFTATVLDNLGGVFELSTTKEITIQRNTISRMSPIEVLPTHDIAGATNLSVTETANCYIVEQEGLYAFNASVIGNGEKGIMHGYGFHTENAAIIPAKAYLLWQDNDIVSDVTMKNGFVVFNASSHKGNAVIAVTDDSNIILWSWHIWATDRPEEIRLTQATHAYLDRNLGATTKELGLQSSNGLLYQWGRKDPFPSDSQFEEAQTPLTVDAFIKHPQTLYQSSWIENPYAFWGNPDGIISDASFKTIYDPCPPGYTIPTDGSWSEYDSLIEYTAPRYVGRYDPSIIITQTDEGLSVSKEGKTIMYPFATALSGTTIEQCYYFRNSWRSPLNGLTMCLETDGQGFGIYYSVPVYYASSIRCIKEEAYTILPPAVETQEATTVKVTDLVLKAKVTNNGNSPIKTVGFYWGESQNDITNRVEATFNTSGYSFHLKGLSPHSTVFVRAFAENEAGRSYGDMRTVHLRTATEYASFVLDSLSRFMTSQYLSTQGMNGEGTIRHWYGDMTGNDMPNNHSGWASLYNLDNIASSESRYTHFPLFYYYRIINKVNSTIDHYLPWADAADPDIDYYKAALLGYRAYSYMMLTQLYCKSWDASKGGSSPGLPLRIHADDDVTVLSTLAEVYQQIFDDLDLAIGLMKKTSVARRDVNDMDLRTLYAIYAKAALNKKDYANAVDYAKLARTSHPLMSNMDYFRGFNEANDEWIWGAIPDYQEFSLYFYAYFAYIGYNSSSSNCRNYPKCFSKELFDRIPATDIRRKLFLDPSGYSYNNENGKADGALTTYGFAFARTEGRPGLYSTSQVYAYMQLKFAATYMPGGGRMNYIRAAEMVLIEAEANYFLGNESETRSLLNYLNKESGRDAAYTCTATGAALLDELKFYRRLELWGEGFNWFDVKRWGDPISRKSFAEGGNFISALAGTWSAADKNDFVWVFPDNYETVIRNGSGD